MTMLPNVFLKELNKRTELPLARQDQTIVGRGGEKFKWLISFGICKENKENVEVACIARRIGFPSIQMDFFLATSRDAAYFGIGRCRPHYQDEEHILPVRQPASQRITQEILPEGGGTLPPRFFCKTQKKLYCVKTNSTKTMR